VPQTPTLPFKLGGTGSNFGETFDGQWKTFQGPSIPENTEKIHTGMGEKLGVQIWGSQITDNSWLQMHRKSARSL